MTRSKKGRALFYTRDSGGQHETTPGEYVAWAKNKAAELGLTFDGTPDRIAAMIRNKQSVDSDLYLDYGISGNVLSRPGLNALLERIKSDASVTHVCIPRRDRMARPADSLDGLNIEATIRKYRVTIVFQDTNLPGREVGDEENIGEVICGLVGYDQARRERRELARKIIHSKTALAKGGHSTGGRAPYGLRPNRGRAQSARRRNWPRKNANCNRSRPS